MVASAKTALVVASTMETLYGMELGQISRFADEAAAIFTVGAPFRREPPALIRNYGPGSCSIPIRHTRTFGWDRETR